MSWFALKFRWISHLQTLRYIRSFDTGVDEDASILGRDAVSTGNYKYSRVDRE
jgi:hypothetical protein